MSEAPRMAFSHIGIYVADIAKMADFYTRVLGFCLDISDSFFINNKVSVETGQVQISFDSAKS
jgi:catechol-2,3-dioxygenase